MKSIVSTIQTVIRQKNKIIHIIVKSIMSSHLSESKDSSSEKIYNQFMTIH